MSWLVALSDSFEYIYIHYIVGVQYKHSTLSRRVSTLDVRFVDPLSKRVKTPLIKCWENVVLMLAHRLRR